MAAPFVGSFLGVLVRRLPDWWLNRLVALPLRKLRSSSRRATWSPPQLGRRARPVPLCGQPIGWFYPAIELAVFAIAL